MPSVIMINQPFYSYKDIKLMLTNRNTEARSSENLVTSNLGKKKEDLNRDRPFVHIASSKDVLNESEVQLRLKKSNEYLTKAFLMLKIRNTL